MQGFKINDHQLVFPQAYGTEFNYCPSLDLSADNSSDQRLIVGIRDNGAGFLLKTRLRSQISTLLLLLSRFSRVQLRATP